MLLLLSFSFFLNPTSRDPIGRNTNTPSTFEDWKKPDISADHVGVNVKRWLPFKPYETLLIWTGLSSITAFAWFHVAITFNCADHQFVMVIGNVSDPFKFFRFLIFWADRICLLATESVFG